MEQTLTDELMSMMNDVIALNEERAELVAQIKPLLKQKKEINERIKQLSADISCEVNGITVFKEHVFGSEEKEVVRYGKKQVETYLNDEAKFGDYNEKNTEVNMKPVFHKIKKRKKSKD
jgi:hypothetical protein